MKVSYVYFIKPVGLDGPIKIGHSDCPPMRLDTLTAWSPWPLEVIGAVPGTLKDEQFLHTCFSDLHSHREWFRSAPHLREAIAKIVAAGNLDAARVELKPKGSIRKKRTLSDATKLGMSMGHRIRWALHRLEIRTSTHRIYFTAPPEISKIHNRCCGSAYRKVPGILPTVEETAVLEAFLASPLDTAIRHEVSLTERWKLVDAPQPQTEVAA